MGRSWWLLMAILTVTMASLQLTPFTLPSSSSSHGMRREDVDSSEQRKHEPPWISPPDLESARRVPTGPDPIHHNQAPPFHRFP